MPLRITPDKRATTRKDIAPCGMNCRVCYATMREKGAHCSGCRGGDTGKSKSCITCRIRNCDKRNGNYCFSCENYPCARLKQLDARYRKNYGMSMIENLERIKRDGIRKFVRSENTRWICADCGTKLCVHRGECPGCGKAWR